MARGWGLGRGAAMAGRWGVHSWVPRLHGSMAGLRAGLLCRHAAVGMLNKEAACPHTPAVTLKQRSS